MGLWEGKEKGEERWKKTRGFERKKGGGAKTTLGLSGQ